MEANSIYCLIYMDENWCGTELNVIYYYNSIEAILCSVTRTQMIMYRPHELLYYRPRRYVLSSMTLLITATR